MVRGERPESAHFDQEVMSFTPQRTLLGLGGQCVGMFDFCSVSSYAPDIEVFSLTLDKSLHFQSVNELFTKTAQSSGPENIGPERTLPGHLALGR